MPLTDELDHHLSATAAANVRDWLAKPKYAAYKTELESLIVNREWQQLEDSFFKTIEFGTAGRRGTTGIGSNRINKVTIGESAQALCEYALAQNPQAASKGMVITCDTRLSSPELSRYAAQVCAANGFKTYLFESFRATPELSFAVRHLHAMAGIVISASHNPPADNGFKVCWTDGGQLVAPHDKGVLAVAAELTEIKVADYDAAVADGRIVSIGKEVDDAYIAAVVNQAEGTQRDLKIVYSPLHGAGQTNVLPVLRAAGFTSVSVVKDQMVPDGNFPTIESGKPNPEEPAANERAIAQLLAEQADIAITNDPDADRIAVIVRHGEDAIQLTGNQAAVLAADYIFAKRAEKGTLSNKDYAVCTIVTTDMMRAVTEHYGATMYDHLTIGFKYIGELIHQKEATDETFIIGGEESYGLLKGDYARDKDGASGALPLAEYAAELKQQGKTLYDRMLELYVQHGLYAEYLAGAYFTGASGFEKMQTVMRTLRSTPPSHIDGHQITAVRDYQTLERRDTKTGETTPINCIVGNVIALELDGDPRRRVTIRPSGTEPKLKFYIQWRDSAEAPTDVAAQYERTLHHLQSLAETMEGIVLE